MQKISPLRASIAAFNNKLKQTNSNNATNPFNMAFKGKFIQMDVFENSVSSAKAPNAYDFFKNSWNGAKSRFANLKSNTIAFGSRLKENAINTGRKVKDFANTKIEFDFFKYSVSKLQNRPVAELKDMLASELKGV